MVCVQRTRVCQTTCTSCFFSLTTHQQSLTYFRIVLYTHHQLYGPGGEVLWWRPRESMRHTLVLALARIHTPLPLSLPPSPPLPLCCSRFHPLIHFAQGLVAKKVFMPGDVLFSETPIVSSASISSHSMVCMHAHAHRHRHVPLTHANMAHTHVHNIV